MRGSKSLVTAAVVISLIFFISAGLVFAASFFNLPEGHPIAIGAFPFVLLVAAPEVPFQAFLGNTRFPIVVPIFTILLAVGGFWREGNIKWILLSILFVLGGVGLYFLAA